MNVLSDSLVREKLMHDTFIKCNRTSKVQSLLYQAKKGTISCMEMWKWISQKALLQTIVKGNHRERNNDTIRNKLIFENDSKHNVYYHFQTPAYQFHLDS